jgi:hypothetical protein
MTNKQKYNGSRFRIFTKKGGYESEVVLQPLGVPILSLTNITFEKFCPKRGARAPYSL